MNEMFRGVLNASFQGGIVILAVLILRLVLKKAPKKYICLLWILAGLRLLMPFSIESSLSLQPRVELVELDQAVNVPVPDYWVEPDAPLMEAPANAEVPQIDLTKTEPEIEISSDMQMEQTTYLYQVEDGEISTLTYNEVAANLWVLGAGVMLFYSMLSYCLLKFKLREAVRMAGDIWESDRIGTAFILGYLRPRIYLPMGLSADQQDLILRHERSHLKRLDHWVKLFGFVALAVHWFNPLVWLAYTLLCWDMELACDEYVVSGMDLQQRKSYSAALLACSSNRSYLAVSPVAFGEKPIKKRIRAVLGYRKPAVWLTAVAVLALIVVAVCFLTDPKMPEKVEDPTVTAESAPTGTTMPAEEQTVQVMGFEEYEYRYTDPRDRAWEEDIVYMANQYLTEFPKVAKKTYFEYRMYQENPGAYLITDNYMYDEEIRTEFILAVHDLLDRIPELNETELIFEVIRIEGILRSSVGGIYWDVEEYFPVMVETMEHEGQLGRYTVRIPIEHQDLLYTRLTAINGIPLEKVMEMLRPYTLSESIYWDEYCLTDRTWSSLIVQKPLLQTVGIMDWDADTAEFTFTADDGTETIVTLEAIAYDEYDAANMAREDFYAKGIGYRGKNKDSYYWYEVMPEQKALYVRVSKCNEHSGYAFQTFLWEVTDILNASEEPLKLIIDIRRNSGGNYPMSGYSDFAKRLPKVKTDGVYFLADYGTGTSGWIINEAARNMEVQVIGTLTGCPENIWGNANRYEAPNGKIEFSVPTCYRRYVEAMENIGVMPDITVYQTLDDYKQGIDTVLEYVLNLKS